MYPDMILFNTLLVAASHRIGSGIGNHMTAFSEPPMYIKVLRTPVCDVVEVCFNHDYFEHLTRVKRPSWSDMYLIEPPITVAQVSVYLVKSHDAVVHGLFNCAYVSATVRERKGLTFAIMLDTMEKMAAQAPSL